MSGSPGDKLYADLTQDQTITEDSLPPVEKWDPPLNGDIDIRITRDGTWIHEGSAITRAPLVKLFSRILKREGDEYFLVTPVEKWRLTVDDAPLHVIAVQRTVRDGQQALVFSTRTEDAVLADSERRIRVETDDVTGEPSPYVRVRNQLDALINRTVYYELVDMAEQRQVDGETVYGVTSMGVFFPLS